MMTNYPETRPETIRQIARISDRLPDDELTGYDKFRMDHLVNILRDLREHPYVPENYRRYATNEDRRDAIRRTLRDVGLTVPPSRQRTGKVLVTSELKALAKMYRTLEAVWDGRIEAEEVEAEVYQ